MAAMAAKAPPNFANVAAAARPKHSPDLKSSARDPHTSDKHAHDRLVFIAASFVGLDAVVTVKSGDQFAGVFSSPSLDPPDPRFVLKMAKKIAASADDARVNGVIDHAGDYVGYGDDHVMCFDVRDVVHLFVPSVSTDKIQMRQPNGMPAAFRTDTDISGNSASRERELTRWEPEGSAALNVSLNGSRNARWDQFEANERLYGVTTDYDESFYTTTIDKSNPSYKDRAAHADRIAREIESSAVTNAHIAEERGLADDDGDGLDEEDKFSGVRREFTALSSSSQNRYTPPARRAPTSQTTVRGAPVDPAIISSQLVRPDSTSKPPKIPVALDSSNKKENATPTAAIAASETPVTSDIKQDLPAARPSEKLAAAKINTSMTANVPPAPHSSKNITQNIESNLLRDFKDFRDQEHLRYQARERAKRNQEKQVKLNDLKKFAQNFKLKTEVPQDMLGILANSKDKQDAIVAKAKKEIEEQTKDHQPASAAAAATAAQSSPTKSSTSTRADPVAAAHQPGNERQRGFRSGQFPPTAAQFGRQDRGGMPQIGPRTGPGHLAERLLANQQRNKGFQNAAQQLPQLAPGAVNADPNSPRSAGGIPTPTSATSTTMKFNAQVPEFKPNPTAISFSPTRTLSRASNSPAVSRVGVAQTTPKRASFFGDKRPSGSKKSVADGFNPILRMHSEVEKEGKGKDFASNGGIPNAFRTPPTWDVPDKNKEKSYKDVLEKTHPNAPMPSPGIATLPHQHQLPPHLQHPGQFPMPSHTPQQGPHHPFPQQYSQGHSRDHYVDDQRMNYATNNHSAFPSPRFQSGMIMPGPMMNPTQANYMQPVQSYMAQSGQPLPFVRQLSNNSQMMKGPGQVAPVVMMNQPGGGPYLSMPIQGQMPMYSPVPHHVFPQNGGPQTPGMPNGFPSPRPGASMMMPSSSQQGHMMYPNSGQAGQPYFPQHQTQQMAMRPMMPPIPVAQPGFSSSPHMAHHFPAQRQPSSYGYSQSIPSGAMLQANNRPSSGPHEEIK